MFYVPSDPKDPIAIERLNLMNMAKLSIKGLIESALNLGRTLDSDYAPLQQFFVVMEHCLKHGLKSMPCNLTRESFPLSLFFFAMLIRCCSAVFRAKLKARRRSSVRTSLFGVLWSLWRS